MSLFRSVLHQEIWIEHNCERCAHYNEEQGIACPILERALRTGRKPVEWDRNTRKNALMQDTIKCRAKVRYLPVRKPKVDNTIAMFDVSAPVDMDDDHA